ncbi:serine/threonine-protein kinase [Nocardiopsis sp. HUAS JQ3]|uniref:serine/threonine-protein kinase n=1 Tax=Nocardiopsis sp. HUAS JQ3 TaxID=3061629 RepID=UPI0023A91FDB|nr:serine/threonine-protein kinase [Nocardiopsis sp. HUAS JQ3]WDZ92731.1 serine/threonine-protein kinase [Nocardiopsis sp. HUAS JQ3]
MQPLLPEDPDSIGPYRLRGRLGSGGMGEVYLALSAGGRPVAVKVVRPEFGADPEFRRRFTGEVEAARRVGGFFTAHVVDADTDSERPWFASAYVPGASLHSAVTEHGPLPEDAVLRLASGTAEGLAAVHGCRLVHRDLKPSNVLLCDDGPRLIDFGIARALEATSLTTSGLVVGTPAYMSPEQARGDRDVGPASDVFSLAGVLVFAATGTPAFGTGQPSAVLYRIVHEAPVLSAVPERLRGLLAACLAKDPGERPGVDEVLAACAVGEWTGEGWLPPSILAMAESARVGGEDAGDGTTAPADSPSAAPTLAATRAGDSGGNGGDGGNADGGSDGGDGGGATGRGRSWWRRIADAFGGGSGDGGERGGRDGLAPRSPSPAPDTLAERIGAGWSGVAWGADVAAFRVRFPGAREQNGWWVSGEPPEPFCGFRMTTQYAIGEDGLFMVSFIPEVEDRDRLAPAVLNALGAPKGQVTAWEVGEVVVEVKIGGIVVTLTHSGLSP